MHGVHESSVEVAAAMRDLGERSERIGGIVETITSIAGPDQPAGPQRGDRRPRGPASRVAASPSSPSRSASSRGVGRRGGEHRHADRRDPGPGTASAVEVVEDGVRRTEDGTATVAVAREAFDRIGLGRTRWPPRRADRCRDDPDRRQRPAGGGRRLEVAALAEQSSASSEQVSASTEQTSASTQEIAGLGAGARAYRRELERLCARFRVPTGRLIVLRHRGRAQAPAPDADALIETPYPPRPTHVRRHHHSTARSLLPWGGGVRAPIEHVQEILFYTPPRPVSSGAPWVTGVISLRGKIIAVYDLALAWASSAIVPRTRRS
jgi:hypothetical protein